MYCYRCRKTLDESAFTKAKACDSCYYTQRAFYEANKEKYREAQRTTDACKKEERQKERERLQHEKEQAFKAKRLNDLASRVCPYEQSKKDGIFSKKCGTCRKEKSLNEFRIITKLGKEQIASNCNACFAKSQARYENQKEDILAKNKAYKQQNADAVLERHKEYNKTIATKK